jgi:uncharacterized protein (DUF433 family)
MSILEALTARPVPLQADADGVLRVAGTRVRLATIITAFNNGASAEEILLKYPSLELLDIYSVLTYYLWHKNEVNKYLEESQQRGELVRRENETCFPSQGVRERLLARRTAKP